MDLEKIIATRQDYFKDSLGRLPRHIRKLIVNCPKLIFGERHMLRNGLKFDIYLVLDATPAELAKYKIDPTTLAGCGAPKTTDCDGRPIHAVLVEADEVTSSSGSWTFVAWETHIQTQHDLDATVHTTQ